MTRKHAASETDTRTRVLIVEDMEWDAELMRHELLRSGLEFDSRLVQAEPAFREALDEFKPDIILADYHLPRFSGMRALHIVQELGLDTPVILVSGAVTEETAIECFRAGVADYLLKENLLRLGPAVETALESARVRGARRKVEGERASLAMRLSAFADSTADAMIVVDTRGTIRFWNSAATTVFGFSADEILGEPVITIVPERIRARHEAGIKAAVSGGPLATLSRRRTTGLHKSGVEVPIELTLGSWDEDGERSFSAVVHDITARLEAERERDLLSAAVEQSSNLMMITDMEGNIQYANPAFETITGYSREEVVGQNPRFLNSGRQSPEFYEEMWAELTAGRSWTMEFVNLRKDGTEYHQRSTVFPIQDAEGRIQNYVGIGQDVTDQLALEKQLRQAQKMEAVGQLTGGIAHDFNNVLAAILTNAQLLAMTLPPELVEEAAEARDIESAARRGADLIKKLMAFSRDEHLELEIVDPSEILQETVGLLKRVLPANIELILEEAHDGALLSVDRSGIQQILLNLATNARDAMPDGGTLAISTALVRPGTGRPELESDARIEITVRDSGVGMDEETLARAFEPFFTTKEEGKGTGLGLAMVHALVERHGGTIEVLSEPGVGTTFVVCLSLAESDEQRLRPRRAPQSAPLVHAGQTLLFVEDEKPLRRAGKRALERFGYRVLLAENGLEGLELLKAHREDVALVVTDFVMPKMGGVELYEATSDWEPRPAFLFTSGYRPSEMGGGIGDGTVPFLRKPWDVAELVEAVHGALDG